MILEVLMYLLLMMLHVNDSLFDILAWWDCILYTVPCVWSTYP